MDSYLILNTGIDGLKLGLCYAILALGMYIAYSILDFPDLTADGSFPLGGVVGTILLYRLNVHPVFSIIGGFVVGMIAGTVTGILHVKFNISKLLSSIITMTALLSVNLSLTKLLTGTGFTTVNFSYNAHDISGVFNKGSVILDNTVVLAILAIIILVLKFSLDIFFKTKSGFMLKATGDNESLITSLGENTGKYKIIGIAIANGFMGLGGALYSQLTRNYDNACGSGKVVLSLASVIIGLAIFSKSKFVKPTTAVIIGAIIYSLCLNYFTILDPDGTYLKIMNAGCFALILIIKNKCSNKLFKKLVKNNDRT